VTHAAERITGRLIDPSIEIEQTRMIGVRLE